MKLCIRISLLLLISLHAWGQDIYPVWNFDSLNFKGAYNKFERSPSSCAIYLCDTFYHGLGGRSLQVNACQQKEGFCGVWMNTFDVRAPGKPRFADLRSFPFLSLHIRGKSGGEQLEIRLADRQLAQREDSRACKPLNTYLSEGITTVWQEVIIPISDFEGVNAKEITTISISFATGGCYEVLLDDICFKKERSTPVPLTTSPTPRVNGRPLENAIWVWESYKLFDDTDYRNRFIHDCRELNVRHAYLQLFYNDSLTAITHTDSLRAVVRACRQAGIRVYALDGSPEWGLYEKHEIPMTILQLVINYNQSVDEQERVRGMHFDIEPYLLLGFAIPELRNDIIQENLFLKQYLSRTCHEHGLTFGADIPCWYEDPDSAGAPIAAGMLNGRQQAMSYHMIDLSDELCIMGYRNFAFGSDGMVSKDEDELRYASTIPGKKIWAGVETFAEAATRVTLFNGLPRKQLQQFLVQNKTSIGRNYRFRGYRLVVLETAHHVHFGLDRPAHLTRAQRRHYRGAVQEFRELLEPWCDVESSASLHHFLHRNRRLWHVHHFRPKANRQVKTHKAVYQPTDAKLTFAGSSREQMLHELYEASALFYEYPAFGGFAFHSYESLLKMKK